MARQFMTLPCDILARTDLSMTAKVVYAVIWDAMRGRDTARVGYGSIAKRSGASRRAIVDAVAQLVARTDLEVSRGGRGAGKTNSYRLRCTDADSALGKGADSAIPPVQNPPTTSADSAILPGQIPHGISDQTTTKTKTKRAQAPSFSWKEIQPQLKGTALDTPEFGETWAAWVAHRREIRKPLTTTTVTRQLKRLKEYGHDLAKAALEFSIERGYQGFDRKWVEQAPGSGARTKRQEDEDKDWGAIARDYDREHGIVR